MRRSHTNLQAKKGVVNKVQSIDQFGQNFMMKIDGNKD